MLIRTRNHPPNGVRQMEQRNLRSNNRLKRYSYGHICWPKNLGGRNCEILGFDLFLWLGGLGKAYAYSQQVHIHYYRAALRFRVQFQSRGLFVAKFPNPKPLNLKYLSSALLLKVC